MGSVFPFGGRGDGDNLVAATACTWVVRVAETKEAEAECIAWRALPAHDEAWREASALWEMAAGLTQLDHNDWRVEIDALSRRGASRAQLSAMAMAVALIAIASVPFLIGPAPMVVGTRPAEARHVKLADGSVMTLGAESRAEIDFGSGKRQIELDHGQAFFDVAHDQNRPFIVIAGDVDIRAIGTKFDVRRDNGDVRVSVLEGRIEVRRRGIMSILASKRPDRVLTAGLKVEFDTASARFSTVRHTPLVAGEWRSGRLYYDEAPLSEIIADIQRYRSAPVRITDPAIARLKVTTSFRADRIDAFLVNLGAILPVRYHHSTDGTIVIEARSPAI